MPISNANVTGSARARQHAGVRFVLFLLSLFLPLGPFLPSIGGVACADERGDLARSHYERGLSHFHLDEYDDAIREFEEAFRSKPDPVFLFNVAQAARLGKRLDMALTFYEKYLRLAPRAPNAVEVRARMAALRKLIAEQKASENARPHDPLPPSPATAEPPRVAAVPQPPPPPPKPEPPSPVTQPPPATAAVVVEAVPLATATVAPAAPGPVEPVRSEPKPPPAPGPTAAPAPAVATMTASNHTAVRTLSRTPVPARTRPRSAARRWWIWTLVGAAAGGGATAGYLFLGRPAVPQADYGPVDLGLSFP